MNEDIPEREVLNMLEASTIRQVTVRHLAHSCSQAASSIAVFGKACLSIEHLLDPVDPIWDEPKF